MPRREDFSNALWSDPDFLALSADARLLYVWTWTNPRCGMAGIYKLAPAAAAYETGLGEERTVAAFEELGAARFAFLEEGVVFVRTRVKHLRQKTEQIAKAIRNDLKQIPDDHPLKAQFSATYRHLNWLSTAFEGDPQEAPKEAAQPGDGRVTVYGTGKGNGIGKKGRGAGRGNNPRPYQPSTEWTAVRDLHFPDLEVGSVESAAMQLKLRRREPTVEAIRELLEGRAA
jgi:hypothetical protein